MRGSLLPPLLVLALLAAGCGSPPPAPPAAAASPASRAGKPEGRLSIVAWAGYVERGERDRAYDWVTPFEKKTGCRVDVKIAATSDEMVALLAAPGFDLVTASGDASLRLVSGGAVQQVDLARIPSWKQVDPRLQNAPWHTVDGRHYGVPYQWGSNVLLYDTKVFPEAPRSWSVVFEETRLPDGASNRGRVQAFGGPIYIADAALYLKSHRPELAISDPYALDQKQFDAAVELLRRQRELVTRYWYDAFLQADDFLAHKVAASSSWPFQVNLLRSRKATVGSAIPEEGATGWADTTMLQAQAPHPNCAYLWLEHSLSLKTQGDLAAWFGSVPAVPAACQGNALLGPEGCATNGAADFDRISFWRTPVADCGGGRQCVPYHEWVTAYMAVLGGR